MINEFSYINSYIYNFIVDHPYALVNAALQPGGAR